MNNTEINQYSYSEKHFGLFFAIFALSLLFLNIGLFIALAWLELVSAVVLASVFIIIAAVMYLGGKKNKLMRWLNPILNSLSCGFFISVYYLQTGKPVDITAVAVMQAVMLMLFALTFWFLKLERFNRIMLVINLLAGLGAVVASIILWDKQTTFYQQMLFTALFYISFVLGQLMYSTKKYGPWFCFASVHFTALSIVFFVVLIVLSEGEGAGDIVAGIVGGSNGKKRKKGKR